MVVRYFPIQILYPFSLVFVRDGVLVSIEEDQEQKEGQKIGSFEFFEHPWTVGETVEVAGQTGLAPKSQSVDRSIPPG